MKGADFMNQEKIGKFIAQLRKEQNLTQLALAEKLGITDRAISKWENGRGLPDLSLLKPLCDELGITINEFLAGERIEKEKTEEKFEENIIQTIDYSNKRIKTAKLLRNISFIIIGLILIIFATLFCIDINRMQNNKPVVFSTWGYKYAPSIEDLDEYVEDEIDYAIDEYVVNISDTESHHNEKYFSAHRTYLYEEKEKNKVFNVYAWVFEEGYYWDKNEPTKSSGSSIPYKFVIEKIDDKWVVTDSKIPRDGALYKEDMKAIFPNDVRKEMKKIEYDGTIENLKADIDKQVKLYFHK